MQDDAFEGDFRAYLLEKHGIQADAPIAGTPLTRAA